MSDNRITFTLNRLVNQLNRAADRILRSQFGITYSQFQFLVVLEACGTIPSHAFAEQLGVSNAAISRRTPWFRERGLIEVGSIAQDGRVVTLTISAQGRELVFESADALERAFRDGFRELKTVDLDSLNHTLLDVLEHLKKQEKDKHG